MGRESDMTIDWFQAIILLTLVFLISASVSGTIVDSRFVNILMKVVEMTVMSVYFEVSSRIQPSEHAATTKSARKNSEKFSVANVHHICTAGEEKFIRNFHIRAVLKLCGRTWDEKFKLLTKLSRKMSDLLPEFIEEKLEKSSKKKF